PYLPLDGLPHRLLHGAVRRGADGRLAGAVGRNAQRQGAEDCAAATDLRRVRGAAVREPAEDSVPEREEGRSAEVMARLHRLAAFLLLSACAAPEAPTPVATARLRIIGTNDFHGAFEPRRIAGVRRGGVAALAATIARAEAECVAPACE